jgi:hypothetical protein
MMLSVVVAVAMLAAVPARASLVAYWPMDGNGNDVIGGVNVSPMAGADLSYDASEAVVGQALVTKEANGANSGLQKDTTGTDFGLTNELTISSWYRIDSVGGSGGKSSFASDWIGYGFYNPDNYSAFGHIVSYVDTLGTSQGKNLYHESPSGHHDQAAGEWWHIAQVIDSSGHVDIWQAPMSADSHAAHAEADQSYDIGAYASLDLDKITNGKLTLGFIENKNNTGGQIRSDEIAIWDEALSSSEIEQLFAAGKAGQSVIPEPASLLMLTLGTVALAARRRR